MRLLRQLSAAVFAVSSVLSAQSAVAQSGPTAKPTLFIYTPTQSTYWELRYNGSHFKAMTTLLQSNFTIVTSSTMPTASDLSKYDAMWVDQRYNVAPTQAELEAFLGFAATGRRVVLVGENNSPYDAGFSRWSAPLIAALGGTYGAGDFSKNRPLPNQGWFSSYDGCTYGDIKSIYKHELAWGLESLYTGCAGFAVGGTSLFSYNAVTLWGQTQNMLTILDTNILDDFFGSKGQYNPNIHNETFRNNLMGWLGDSQLSAAVTTVPEPSTYALLAPALFGIAFFARRRRA